MSDPPHTPPPPPDRPWEPDGAATDPPAPSNPPAAGQYGYPAAGQYGYPYPYPYPYAYGYGYATAPAPAAVREGVVYGLDDDAKPGRVPWGFLQVVLAILAGIGMAFSVGALAAGLALALGFNIGGSGPVTSAADSAALVALTALTDGCFVLAAWIFSLRRSRLPMTSWGLRRVGWAILWVVPVVLVAVIVLNAGYEGLYQYLSGHPSPEQDIFDSFPRGLAGILLLIFLAVGVAPIVEEVVFRGFLFQGLARSWGLVPGIVVSAAFFSLIHVQLTTFVPLFTLGVALAWVFYYTRSLWTSIALHAVFNSFGVLVWALTS